MTTGTVWASEAKVSDSHQGYHQFHTEDSKDLYGSFEVFWDDADEAHGHGRNFDDHGELVKPGWYWWACSPGCIPDSYPSGPFASSIDAFYDADTFHPDNGAWGD